MSYLAIVKKIENLRMSIFSKLVSVFGSDNKNIEMVIVQGGKFKMGEEATIHTVTVSDFYMAKILLHR